MCALGRSVSFSAGASTTFSYQAHFIQRTSTPLRPAKSTLTVLAFREDGRSGFTKQGKAQASRIAQQAKQEVQKAQRQIKQRGGTPDFEEVAKESSPTVYVLNAMGLALAAGVAAFNPVLTSKILIQPEFLVGSDAAGLVSPLVRILALGVSGAAVINFIQSEAAKEDQLDETIHKRLNASLSTFSIAQLGLLGLLLTPLSKSVMMGYNGAEVLNASGIGVLGVLVAIQLYVAGVNYYKTAPEGYNPVADAKSWLRDVRNTFKGCNGPISTTYAVLTAALLAAGLSYIFVPLPTLFGVFGSSVNQAGPESIVLWQLIGAGVSMIVGPITYSLKEGAAASSLSDTKYKLLNVALFTAGVGHLLVLQPRLGDPTTAGPLLPIILGTWATAALVGGVNLLQNKRARGA